MSTWPTLGERRHRGPARRRVTMRQRAIFVLPEGEVDRHGLPTGAAAVLHDARATTAVGASYSGVSLLTANYEGLSTSYAWCQILE